MDIGLSDEYTAAQPDRLAVEVRNAYKRFTKDSFVLKGFNMSVEKGSIYGLLGPSGCGKTTLLNCMVGRDTLDAGEIKLLVSKKRDIGYMPQELCLYKEFSIWETFVYFGKLYKIPIHSLQRKSENLKCLLNLPALDSQFGNLSGGQQRRVSFAVVLLHDPQLMILDEPTVGVDPILSASIWAYLLELSQKGKTIVITTHYIEEAKQAHCIGLMRDGVLLAESSPNDLMRQNNSPTLEDAFLILSVKQQEDSINRNTENSFRSHPNTKSSAVVFEESEIWSASRTKAQLLKQYYWMKRNISGVLFAILLPVLVLLAFDFSIGHPPKNVSMAVINRDALSQYRGNTSDCPETLFSCQYLEYLKKYNVSLVPFGDADEAIKAVKKNYVWGLIEFSQNYSSSLLQRINLGKGIDLLTEENSNVLITMDSSSFIMNWLMYNSIYRSYEEFATDALGKLNVSDKLVKIPISFQKPVYGSFQFDFGHYAMPALLIMLLFYLPFVFTSASVVMEKTQGLMERSLTAGVTEFEVFISHMVIQTSLLILQLSIIMIIQFYVFQYRTNNNLLLPFVLLLMEGLCGTFFGFSAGFLCESQIAITFVGIGTIVPQFFISGMLWPIEGMHPLLKAVSLMLPLTIPVESLRAMFLKNWSILYPSVYKGFICTSIWIVCFVVLSSLGLKYRKGFKPIK